MYKHLDTTNICNSCTSEEEVNIKIDIFSSEIRKPSILKEVGRTMMSVNGVNCEPQEQNFEGPKQDEIDIEDDCCRLYDAGIEYDFSDYSGDLPDRVSKAVRDTLQEARDIYTKSQ